MLASAGILYVLSRSERGQVVFSDAVEDVIVSADQIRAALTPARERYRPLFDAATVQHNLPAGLLMRVAQQESAFNPNARSPAGAVGIMQVVPRFHPELGEEGALDPVRAIPYAAKLLRGWRNQFGSWTLALAAYNAGPGNVTKYNGVPPFTETRNYVAKILPDVGIVETGVRFA